MHFHARSGFPTVLAFVFLASLGCHKCRPSVTAVPLSPWNACEPEGIPYYLPKPLLVVAKNVRHIDEKKIGLTNPVPIPSAFDNQASYGDIKANVSIPGTASQAAANTGNAAAPTISANQYPVLPTLEEKMIPEGRVEDGLAPDSFFTYQIVFVPDLSQKYGLRVKGGPGEMRAAMNLVNGWMYTGMGPFYLKDSSTAQNLMAFGVGSMYAGRGVADVLNEVGNLASLGAGQGKGESGERQLEAERYVNTVAALAAAVSRQQLVPHQMLNYAEIHIYEPISTPDGQTAWQLVAEHHFDREFFTTAETPAPVKQALERAIEQLPSVLNPPTTPPAAPAKDGSKPVEKSPAAKPSTGQLPGSGVEESGERTTEGGAPTGEANNSISRLPAANAVSSSEVGPLLTSGLAERFADQMLGLPASTHAAPNATPGVTVNVDSNNSRTLPRLSLSKLFHREPPTVTTKVKSLVGVSGP